MQCDLVLSKLTASPVFYSLFEAWCQLDDSVHDTALKRKYSHLDLRETRHLRRAAVLQELCLVVKQAREHGTLAGIAGEDVAHVAAQLECIGLALLRQAPAEAVVKQQARLVFVDFLHARGLRVRSSGSATPASQSPAACATYPTVRYTATLARK